MKNNSFEGNEFGAQSIIIELLNSLSAIKELSSINYQAENEKELIKKALSTLVDNQDMERTSFFLLDKQGYLVNLTGLSNNESSHSIKSGEYKPLQFEMGEGVIGVAAQTGEIQHCKNCLEDKRFLEKIKKDKCILTGSIISVPVFTADNELLGVLNISHPQSNYFSDWHIRLLEIYKNMLAQLISNFRMFRDMESQISTRTEKLESTLVDIKKLQEHYKEMSMIDSLTGLYNRRYFFDQVGFAVANSKRYGHSLCLLMLDLDHFKEANDVYGHNFGDIVLKKVAKTLQQQVRDTDILARYGGEEFVVIYTNTDRQNGYTFSERIRTQIEALTWGDKKDYSQTVSIGLYFLDAKHNLSNEVINIDNLINYADIALYEAKKQGRNRIVMFDGSIQQD